jgi:hypothetical protein
MHRRYFASGDAADPFVLSWPVHRAGYEIARVMLQEPPGLGDGT